MNTAIKNYPNSKKEEKVITVLKEVGFYKLTDNLDQLCEMGKKMSISAGKEIDSSSFEALPSFIPSTLAKNKNDKVIVIDVGGTSTKAAVRSVDSNGKESWDLLFDIKNDKSANQSTEDSFSSFINFLASSVNDSIKNNKDKYNAIGIVWSNAIENKPLDDGSGITGVITQIEEYNKNEWFIKDLTNGRDIGSEFISAFKTQGFKINNFIITNDTPLTMKAFDGDCDSGMVASTGLNATLLKSAEEIKIKSSVQGQIVCNSEMGGRFFLPKELLCSADIPDTGHSKVRIESLSAGRFMPQIFSLLSFILADLGFDELKSHKDKIQSSEKPLEQYRAKDLSLIISDTDEFLQRRKTKKLYSDHSPECIETLKILAREVIIRSAKLCAVIACSSISNLFENKNDFTISLDSRLSREIKLFKDTLFTTSEELMPANKTIKMELMKPITTEDSKGKVSVPMQGAARALDNFLN